MKKALITGLLLISTITGVYSYTDSELQSAKILASKGIIVSQSNPDNYNMDNFVLRQEIAAISRASAGIDKSSSCNSVYSDVGSTFPNSWACNSVEPIYYAGIIAGNSSFRPEDNITKAEALGMLIKANCTGSDYAYNASLSASWQSQLVTYTTDKGITATFTDYNSLATRGWIFERANKVINYCTAMDFTNGDIDQIDTFIDYLLGVE